MRNYLLATAVLAVAGPGYAADLDLKPIVDARLRYENVDQQGLADETGDALTLRVRAGVSATSGSFSALVEGQGLISIAGDSYDGLHPPATEPLIADPQNIALYRAQLQYRSKAFTLTGGRQKITIDDERFIGNVGFRQNAQTFDAVRAEISPLKDVKLDVSYAWRVHTIWGIDGTGTRPRSIGGDNVFANLGWKSPIGTLSGFAYLVDQHSAAVQAYRLSSQTFGARLAGALPLSKSAKLGYQLSYARQSDWQNNPNDYAADYWLADASLDISGFRLNAGAEILGASDGRPYTSFQTPLGTNFKFLGWADKFLTTPPDGVHDYYAGGAYGWKQAGPLKAINLQAAYHRFASDRDSRVYGDEIDLLASAKVGKTGISARFARYDAKSFATDTTKFWLQLDWVY